MAFMAGMHVWCVLMIPAYGSRTIPLIIPWVMVTAHHPVTIVGWAKPKFMMNYGLGLVVVKNHQHRDELAK